MYLKVFACERCSHFLEDGRYCQYWGVSDPWENRSLALWKNRFEGCGPEFTGPDLDAYLEDIIQSVGAFIGRGALIEMVKKVVPLTQRICGDLCTPSLGKCDQCHSKRVI